MEFEHDSADSKNSLMGLIEQYPKVLMISIGVLIVVILVLVFNIGGVTEKMSGGKKKKQAASGDELDQLIESIHNKQKSTNKSDP